VVGQVLLAAVAIAVTAIVAPALIGQAAVVVNGAVTTAATGLTATLGATGGAIAGGALGAAAGSIASQGLGVATGLQNSFSWKGVGLAALSGGIGGGLGASGVFGQAAKGGFQAGALGITNRVADAAIRGLASNALTQGIGRLTGLQSKFSFAGVATAAVVHGVGAGAGAGSGASAQLTSHLGNAAGALAGAAARSLLTGSDFGDTILSVLPDVLGAAVWDAADSALSGRWQGRQTRPVDGVGVAKPPPLAIMSDPALRMERGLFDRRPLLHFSGPDGAYDSAMARTTITRFGIKFDKIPLDDGGDIIVTASAKTDIPDNDPNDYDARQRLPNSLLILGRVTNRLNQPDISIPGWSPLGARGQRDMQERIAIARNGPVIVPFRPGQVPQALRSGQPAYALPEQGRPLFGIRLENEIDYGPRYPVATAGPSSTNYLGQVWLAARYYFRRGIAESLPQLVANPSPTSVLMVLANAGGQALNGALDQAMRPLMPDTEDAVTQRLIARNHEQYSPWQDRYVYSSAQRRGIATGVLTAPFGPRALGGLAGTGRGVARFGRVGGAQRGHPVLVILRLVRPHVFRT
jgi:hypothetical protein